MTSEERARQFESGFEAGGVFFWPLAYFERVDEPLYGCEERLSDQAFGALRGETAAGPFCIPIEEQDLNRCGLFDDTWLGWAERNGLRELFTWQPGPQKLCCAVRGPWLKVFCPGEAEP